MVAKVKFDIAKNKIHNMVVWRYAYEQARKGGWQIIAIDRSRFERRIVETHKVLIDILNDDHRNRIFSDRFCNYNN